MSFDIHIMAFSNGQICEADDSATRVMLDLHTYKTDDESSCYDVTFSDGSSLELYASGLHDSKASFQGAMINLRMLSEATCQFIYDFIIAGSCVAIPVMDSRLILITDPDQTNDLPDEISESYEIILVSSGTDVAAAIEEGFISWADFRDRVVSDESQDT